MAIKVNFLDWHRPCLAQVVELFIAESGSRTVLDLGDRLVVVPSARAGRRLLELLVERAEADGLRLLPPELVTQGALPERLYIPAHAPGSNSALIGAWARVLSDAAPEELSTVLGAMRDRPDQLSMMIWAERLHAIWREIGGAGIGFDEVARISQRLTEYHEEERWLALHAMHQRYLRVLHNAEVSDPCFERIKALEHSAIRCEKRIELIGVCDPPRILRDMLARCDGEIRALVFAAESHREGFDETGRLITEWWHDRELKIADNQICFVPHIFEQAEAIAASFDRGFELAGGIDRITLGVGDEGNADAHCLALGRLGYPARNARGASFLSSAPGIVLRQIAGFLSTGSFKAFAELLRSTAVAEWLAYRDTRCRNALAEADLFHSKHLPYDTAPILRLQESSALRCALELITTVIAPLRGGPRLLADWCEPICGILEEIFSAGGGEIQQAHSIKEAEQILTAALEEICDAPSALMPELDGAGAITLILSWLSAERIPQPALGAAVEALGWLELLLDDAPVLTISDFNEGRIPQSLNADPFLPDSLRHLIGATDNDRRFARDLYLLSALQASKEQLVLIAPGEDHQGGRLLPSRLLYCCSPQQIAMRVAKAVERPESGGRALPYGGGSRFSLPFAARAEAVLPTEFSVTSFREYLKSPYSYYLRYIERLEQVNDLAEELQPPRIGQLMHELVEALGKSECRSSGDARLILQFLEERFDQLLNRQCGPRLHPAAAFQGELLRFRLKELAEWQAKRAAQGWNIEHLELSLKTEIDLDGECFTLSGKADRIERGPGGELAIIDFKFPDKRDPYASPIVKREWKDLQLPLYRELLLRSYPKIDRSDLCALYVVSDAAGRVTDFPLACTEGEYAGAWEKMLEIVRCIRRREFPLGKPEDQAFSVLFGEELFEMNQLTEESQSEEADDD